MCSTNASEMNAFATSLPSSHHFGDNVEYWSSDGDEDTRQPLDAGNIIRINVGGRVFETLRHTVEASTLANKNRLFGAHSKHYIEARGEYFFDRDPDVFAAVLNYCREGEMHLPLHICGPRIRAELAFWGVKQRSIEKCCWIHYVRFNVQKMSLIMFEKFFEERPPMTSAVGKMSRLRVAIWQTTVRPAKAYTVWLATLVAISIGAFVMETIPELNRRGAADANHSTFADITSYEQGGFYLEICDYIIMALFTFDFVLRLFCAPNRRDFLRSSSVVVEIVSVLPYYVDIGVHLTTYLWHHGHAGEYVDLIRFVHILRIFGMLRVFKLMRHYSGLQVLVFTLKSSYKDLLLMLVFISMATLLFASLMFYVENNDAYSSIPKSCWWAIITITTVGFGDMVPSTVAGYIIGSACAFVGVLVIACTVPILVNNFMLYYSYARSVYIFSRGCRRSFDGSPEDCCRQ